MVSDEVVSDKKEQPVIAGMRSIKMEMEPGEYWWCSCGKSKNQPFCDGSHKGSSFEPMKFEVTEAKRLSWCACKHSEKKPLCDGSHNRLPGGKDCAEADCSS